MKAKSRSLVVQPLLLLLGYILCLSPSSWAQPGAAGQERPLVMQRLAGDKMTPAQRIRLKPKAAVQKPATVKYYKGAQREHLIVKFVDGSRIRAGRVRGIEDNDQRPVAWKKRLDKLQANTRRFDAYDLALLKKQKLGTRKIKAELKLFRNLVNNSKVAGWGKLFSLSDQQLGRLRKNTEVKTKRQAADLANYYWIELEKGSQGESLANSLNALDLVEIAYLAPIPYDADIAPPTDNLQPTQGYLNSAPQGIDANYAQTIPGGNGNQVKIVDIEQGWNLSHEDLPSMFMVDGRFSDSSKDHGTAVMGVMLAKNDGSGVTGIVPSASGGVVSARRSLLRYSVADAISTALPQLSAGDVVLIEQHSPTSTAGQVNCSCNQAQCGYVAMEYWQAEFDIITAASASGVIVVEAAGNGSAFLDHSRYKDRFNRAVRNSGAIFVGGGQSNNRAPRCWTNHGSRLDVQGWGENVVTTGYGRDGLRFNGVDENQWYTASFSGTSSASPIVAGAVASIQGMQIARARSPLDWFEMANLLKDTGTAQGAGVAIGPLPNLRAAMDQQIGAQSPGGNDDNGDGDIDPEEEYVFETTVTMPGDLLDSVPSRSGFTGDRTRTIGIAGDMLAIERIKMGERSDRPCFMQAEKAHITNNTKAEPHENIDICGSNGPTNSSQKFVPTITASHDTFIHGVSVCNSKTRNNTRLKGVKLYRTRVEQDGSLSRLSNPTTFDRPNCDGNWRSIAECPANSLATKLVVHIEEDGSKDVITGLGLRCKAVVIEEQCVSSNCP